MNTKTQIARIEAEAARRIRNVKLAEGKHPRFEREGEKTILVITDEMWQALEVVIVRRCTYCNAPFIPTMRQEYCSLEHSQRMRNEKKKNRK